MSSDPPPTAPAEALISSLHRHLLLYCIGLAVLIYGYEIGSYSLSIDEEMQSFYQGIWRLWVAQGRWGMGMLVFLLPERIFTLPYIPTLLFATGLGIGACFLTRLLTTTKETALAFAAIFISCPIWAHIAEFSTLAVGVIVGLVLAGQGMVLLRRSGWWFIPLSGLCAAAAFAFYQSLFILYVAGGLCLCVRNLFQARSASPPAKPEQALLVLRNLVLGSVCAILLYYLVNYLFLEATHVHTVYVDQWLRILSKDSQHLFTLAFTKIKEMLVGEDPTFLGCGKVSLLPSVAGLLVAVYVWIRSPLGWLWRTLVFLAALAIVFLAVALILAAEGVIPTRALVVFPLIYAALAAIAVEFLGGRRIILLATAAALFINFYVVVALFYADHLARLRDEAMSIRIINRLEEIGVPQEAGQQPFTVYGEWHHDASGPAHRVEVFGDSFFEHDGGSEQRAFYYFKLLGVEYLTPVPLKQVQGQLEDIAKRPSWPHKDSVFMAGSVAVIKFGPLSYQQSLGLQK